MQFKYLKNLFWISILLLLYIQFSPYRIPVILEGTENKINDLLANICFTYIASFIFYYLVVYLKEKRDRENLKDLVAKYTSLLFYNYKRMIIDLQSGKEPIILFPDEEKLKEILSSIDPSSSAPLLMGTKMRQADWFDYLDYVFDRHKGLLIKLESLMPHLNTELIKILGDLDFHTNNSMDYAYFRSWQVTNKRPYKSLIFTFDKFKSYQNSIFKLKAYYDNTFGVIH